MKKIIFILTILSGIYANAQTKPYYKQTIEAYEFNKKDTINKKVLVTFLDSLRKTITTENNIENAISGSKSSSEKTRSVIEVDTDRLYISANIDQKGDTLSKLIYVFDENKNRTENYQIRNGDTINGQKRIYNQAGKSTKLYNKKKDGHAYFLSMEWQYDSNGNLIENKTFNEAGKIVGLDQYENINKKDENIIIKSTYINGKGFVKQYKEFKKSNITTTYFYYERIGYNYGIKINHMVGGMSIRVDDDQGYLKDLKIFDERKNIIAHVMSKEEQIYP